MSIAPPSPPGQFQQSYADLLFVKGFDAVIGFTQDAPTANLAAPVPNSQFPPL
ncbi:MAG TPA: hypothetical protein VFZ97_08520 [Acidimicrobiales bacterium]